MLTVLILSSTLGATLAVSEIVRNGLLMGSTQYHSTQAYFAAEAGAEKILWEMLERDVLPAPYDFNFKIEEDD